MGDSCNHANAILDYNRSSDVISDTILLRIDDLRRAAWSSDAAGIGADRSDGRYVASIPTIDAGSAFSHSLPKAQTFSKYHHETGKLSSATFAGRHTASFATLAFALAAPRLAISAKIGAARS